MANRAELGIDITADAADAAAAADQVSAAYSDMGKSIDTTSRALDDGTDRMGHAAEGADNLASKSSQATGGLGALSAGFELVGAEKYAMGLQSAAMATDFFSGVGDIGNLVLESTAFKTAKNTVLKIKDAVVTRAQAAATAVMTGAQWALNAAMSANPLALVVIAVVALTAAFIIAYKKSETFRRIVDAAFQGVKRVVTTVVDAVVGTVTRLWSRTIDLFGRLRTGVIRAVDGVLDFVRGHWPLLLAIITGPIGLAVLFIVRKWDDIKSATSRAFDAVRNTISGFVDRIQAGVQRLADAVRTKVSNVVGFFQDLPSKILHAIGDVGHVLYDVGGDLIDGFIDGIGDKFGDVKDKLGDLTGSLTSWKGPPAKDASLLRSAGQLVIDGLIAGFDDRRTAVKSALGRFTDEIQQSVQATTADPLQLQLAGGTGTDQLAARGGVTIVVQGAVDPVSTAKQIRDLLSREATWQGRVVGVAG